MRTFIQCTAIVTIGAALAGSAGAVEVMVASDIATSATWTANNTYNLQDQIYVLPGATLTIQAGTVIASDTNLGGSLAVAKGAQIFVQGTQANPVIMTSKADVATWSGGNPKTGTWREGANEWGNLTLMGAGFISEDATAGNVPTCNANNVAVMEGLVPDFVGDTKVLYGGGNDNDDSGSISYLSIRYGGKVIGLNNELNGLSLGGIGRGTDIHHVEVMNNVDDGVEIWGGTVNVRHFAIWNVGDDSFDVDQGWRGKAQFGLIVQGYSADADQGSGVGDNCFELDGAEDSDWQPVTTAVVYNCTVIGQPIDGDGAMAWRDNARVQFRNCVFMDMGERVVRFDNLDGDGANGYGFNGTLSWAQTWTTPFNVTSSVNPCPNPAVTYQAQTSGNLIEVTDSVFFNNNAADAYTEANNRGVFNAGNDNALIAGSAHEDSPIQSIQRGPAVVRGNKVMLPVTYLDPRPKNQARVSVAGAPNDGFFTTAMYRGAFAPDLPAWTHRWTASDAYGFTGRNIGEDYCTPSLNSTGKVGVTMAVGSALASPLHVTLVASPVPNTTGLFFFGPNRLASEPAFGEGKRCVGGTIKRIFPVANAVGNVRTQPLNPGASYAGQILSGASLKFQYWFREAMSAGDLDGDGIVEPFSTSNAVEIDFQ